ncbi:MAG TPA: hypothetical protein VLJ86_01495 [Ramlibacter sp.]|nr:hypothetical protein [Ramlibacter sp.]
MNGILRWPGFFVDSSVNTESHIQFVDDHVDIRVSHQSNIGAELASDRRIDGICPKRTDKGHEVVKPSTLSTSMSKHKHAIGAKGASR